MPLPFLTAGAGSTIPVAGGAATSGDAFSGDVRFAPVNVGGLFGSSAQTDTVSKFLLPALVIAGAVLAFTFLRKK